MRRRARILLALDSAAANSAAKAQLEASGHEVRTGATQTLERSVTTFRPDLVIFEAPEGDADPIATTVRRTQSSCLPLLLCAVDGRSSQRTAALEAGADAYVQRPFTDAELVVHVQALLRRSPWLAKQVHRVGELVIDEDAHVVIVGDQVVSLPVKEFKLLAMLASHQGSVLSKRSLLEAVWGYDVYDENLVEVHMSGLRRRLPPEGSRLIRTVRGIGYVLRDDLPLERLA